MMLRLSIFGYFFLLLLGRAVPACAQVEYLSLDQQTLDLPQRTFYIEQVLDGRTDRAGIGRIRPQAALVLTGSLRPADLYPNLVQGLTSFLQTQLPARPTDRPALLLVRELRVGELFTNGTAVSGPTGLLTGTGGGIIRQARAVLDLYLHAADGYHFVQTATDTVRPTGMLGITPSHERNLKKTLERCLQQLSTPDWKTAQARPAQSLEALTKVGHVASPTLLYAILTTPVVPGYFPTFLSFRNNQPVPVPGLQAKATPRTAAGWENLPELTPVAAAGHASGVVPAGSWGFSDGQQLYIYHQGRYAILQRQENSFGFMGMPDNASQELKAGNLLGAALANRRPQPYTLDMVTGRTTQFADAGRPASANWVVRIYVYRNLGAGPALPVFLNDQAVGELTENQVLTLTWTDPVHEPHLRLGSATAPELTFLPNFRQPVYVRGARKLDPAKQPLEIVPTRVGEFDLKAIRLRTRK
ncbi:hypothetical protein [Hymenobacter sp. BRD67]|uniref:hypothetical protein n=1 Tax=Hymenobacter sp. BRD67 TaxID=2675877 RepID=UPI001564C1BC|nr:hypothetical protein [Hymenobacter sp. BRD67]QKG53077.1 hypothetical protein GKZ67_11295 [Hymenobacter sp. BRD67]